METVVVTGDNEDQWRSPIHQFARDLDLYWRCNTPAVLEENFEATFPTEEAVQHFIDEEEAFVVIVEDAGWVKGYALSSRDGLIKWAGMHPANQDQWPLIIYAVYERYGKVWGRVMNDAMRESLLDNVPELHPAEDDPVVIGIF